MDFCPDCNQNLDDVPDADPCPNCGSTRRSVTLTPPPAAAVASALTPTAEVQRRWTDGALTLVGIWYGTLVAAGGVVTAMVGGLLAMWLYVGSVLLAALTIFWWLRGWLMKVMYRYQDWVWRTRIDGP